jgi:hypothetical protein
MEREIRKENEIEMEKNIHYKEKYIEMTISLHACSFICAFNLCETHKQI